MADKTKISWSDATWNPLGGCTMVSEGCKNCYAMRAAHRMGRTIDKYKGTTKIVSGRPVWTGRINLDYKTMHQPLRWRRPRMIFVNSMSDLFHDNVPDDFIADVFAVMGRARNHTFQVLTKRADRMARLLADCEFLDLVDACDTMLIEDVDSPIGPGHGWDSLARSRDDERAVNHPDWEAGIIPKNIWMGISIENQETADERIPLLLKSSANVKFISAEPLLAPVVLKQEWLYCEECRDDHWPGRGAIADNLASATGRRPWRECCRGIDQVIVGGESGPGARPMSPAWAQALRDQCIEANVAYFFKQWGAWSTKEDPEADYGEFHGKLGWIKSCMCNLGTNIMYRIGKKRAGRILDGREWNEMPG